MSPGSTLTLPRSVARNKRHSFPTQLPPHSPTEPVHLSPKPAIEPNQLPPRPPVEPQHLSPRPPTTSQHPLPLSSVLPLGDTEEEESPLLTPSYTPTGPTASNTTTSTPRKTLAPFLTPPTPPHTLANLNERKNSHSSNSETHDSSVDNDVYYEALEYPLVEAHRSVEEEEAEEDEGRDVYSLEGGSHSLLNVNYKRDLWARVTFQFSS